MAHTHKEISSTTRGWTHCVNGDGCSGAAHGGVTYREVCSCGAERLVESNGRHRNEGPWLEREERLSPGDGARVQFRCDRAVREAVLRRANGEKLSEREAWEAAGREWAAR